MRNRFAFFVSLLLLPTAAGAGVELTLAVGPSWGETAFPIEATSSVVTINCFTTPCLLAEATTEEESASPSLILDVPISRRWMVEALLFRQRGDLELRSQFSPDILDRETYEATTAQVGLLRQWGEGRLRPFAAGAVGLTRFESTAWAYEPPLFAGTVAHPVDEEVTSGSAAAGLKTVLARHLTLRLEGRVHRHDLPRRLGGTLQQSAATAGLTYRW